MSDETAKLSRRAMLPLAGLAPFGLTIGPEMPVLDPLTSGGLRVVLVHVNGEWRVCVPDIDAMDIENWGRGSGWRPGIVPQWKWMPLAEYLAEVERVCGIDRPSA